MLLYIKRICFYSKSKFRPTWLTRDVDDRLVLVHRVETQLRWKTILSQFEESKFENISVRINIWKSWIYFPPALGCLSIGCLSTWAGQRRSKAGYSTWGIIYDGALEVKLFHLRQSLCRWLWAIRMQKQMKGKVKALLTVKVKVFYFGYKGQQKDKSVLVLTQTLCSPPGSQGSFTLITSNNIRINQY